MRLAVRIDDALEKSSISIASRGLWLPWALRMNNMAAGTPHPAKTNASWPAPPDISRTGISSSDAERRRRLRSPRSISAGAVSEQGPRSIRTPRRSSISAMVASNCARTASRVSAERLRTSIVKRTSPATLLAALWRSPQTSPRDPDLLPPAWPTSRRFAIPARQLRLLNPAATPAARCRSGRTLLHNLLRGSDENDFIGETEIHIDFLFS